MSVSESAPLKVLFLLPNLEGGGAERIALTYLDKLDRVLFEPTLVLCERAGALLDRIPPEIPVYSLDKTSRFDVFRLIKRFRKLVDRLRPDIVVSLIWYADAIHLLAKRAGGPVSVCCIHAVPESIKIERYGRVKLWLSKWFYRRSDHVVTVSQAIADSFADGLLGGRATNLSVQYNPFPFKHLRQAAAQRDVDWPIPSGSRLIFVGRLEYIKGLDLLIEAVSRLPSGIDWHLKILGSGSLDSELRNTVQESALAHRISFEGFVDSPYPYIASADMLVLPSRFEAFPSVIVEALALKKCVVAFDCPSGPGQIITHGHNGYLVESGDSQALASAIQSLLEDPGLRRQLASNGPESVAHMESDTVINAFQNLLLTACQAERGQGHD